MTDTGSNIGRYLSFRHFRAGARTRHEKGRQSKSPTIDAQPISPVNFSRCDTINDGEMDKSEMYGTLWPLHSKLISLP